MTWTPLPGIEGTRYGRLVAVREVERGPRNLRRFLCHCDCGAETIVGLAYLRSGSTRSCGCLRDELLHLNWRKHGESAGQRTPEYRSWKSMCERCQNPHNRAFPGYGGRGISVCDRWRNSYEAFLADMSRRPTSRHSLDRINVDGNYEPGNCRWATMLEQNNNRRSNRRIEIGGEGHTVAEWARLTGTPKSTILARLEDGWDAERAIFAPVRRVRRRTAA